MIFHENSCHILPFFRRKLGKMLQNLSSAAVVIGALGVKLVIRCFFVTWVHDVCIRNYSKILNMISNEMLVI